MGWGPNLTSDDWHEVKREKKIDTATSYRDIYRSDTVKDEYNPKGIIRESRDSELHPMSTPIVIGLDSTGSMGHIYELVAKKAGDLALSIFDKNIVTDPQIMFAAVNDYFYSGGDIPLQVTQFEVDKKIIEQLTELKYSGHGGGNSFESYPLLWYFCSRHTSIDSYEKRNQKGFLVTTGDDAYPDELTREEIKDVFGDTLQDDLPTKDLVAEINKKYEIYHISLEQGGSYSDIDMEKWKKLLGTHALSLSDYNKLPELIISLLQVHYGTSVEDAVKDWDGTTGMVIRESLKEMLTVTSDSTGLVKF